MPSYRPPSITTITPGQIGGLSAAHNNTGTSLATSLEQLQADQAFANRTIFGRGRLLSTWPDAGAGRVVDGGGLLILFPDATWLIGGRFLEISELPDYVAPDGEDPGYVQVLGPLVPGTWYGYAYLALSGGELAFTVNWFETAQPDQVAQGRPLVAIVETDSDSIVSISYTGEDVVYPHAILSMRIAAAETGGGGGEGGAATAEELPFEAAGTGTDTRMTNVVVKAFRDELRAYVDEQIANGGLPREEQTPLDQLYEHIDGTLRAILDSHPHALRRFAATVNRPGVWGDESNDGPETDLGGTLPAVPEQRHYDPEG